MKVAPCFVVKLRSGSLLSVARYPHLTASKLATDELHQEGNGEQHCTRLDAVPHPTLYGVHAWWWCRPSSLSYG